MNPKIIIDLSAYQTEIEQLKQLIINQNEEIKKIKNHKPKLEKIVEIKEEEKCDCKNEIEQLKEQIKNININNQNNDNNSYKKIINETLNKIELNVEKLHQKKKELAQRISKVEAKVNK